MSGESKKEQSLTLYQRILSASVGAILTSLLVTPLDVVKTRLQAQAQFEFSENPVQCPRCTHFTFCNGLMDHTLPKSFSASTFSCIHQQMRFNGTFDALFKIIRYEGLSSLYNGLPPTLLMAVPATVLYFASYDKLKLIFDNAGWSWTSASLTSGSTARIIAVTVISPLELVRTQMQAMQDPPNMLRTATVQIRSQGFFSLWKGLSPTLFRDVPFSGIYWLSVEGSKRYLTEHYKIKSPITISFLSGAFSGIVAATATTPFDVIKTRKQVFDYNIDNSEKRLTIRDIYKRILRTEGVSGFYTGLIPRLGKVTPACAVMLSTYEAGKQVFLSTNMEEAHLA